VLARLGVDMDERRSSRSGTRSTCEDEADGGVRLIARLDAQALGRFERQFPDVWLMATGD
jgi:GTP-binding protein HflX